MLNANQLLKKGLEQVKAAGIVPGNVNPVVKINSRAKGRFGLCRSTSRSVYKYEIELNEQLLHVDEKKAMNTMVHEILHTCEGCMNHGPRWKMYAAKMNEMFGYNITRSSTYESFGIEKPKAKYILRCKSKKCGHETPRTRMSQSVKNYSSYRCGKCKGPLELLIDGVLDSKQKAPRRQSTTPQKSTQAASSTITEKLIDAKYIIQCSRCKKQYGRSRMSAAVKNYANYKCPCGGSLNRIK